MSDEAMSCGDTGSAADAAHEHVHGVGRLRLLDRQP